MKVLAAVLLTPTVAFAQVPLGPNEIPATDNRLALGVGYNTLTGSVTNYKCAEVKPRREQFDNVRMKQAVTMDRGNTFEQRSRTETSRARASFGYGGFSASATHQSMQSATTSHYTEFLILEGRVRFYRDLAFKNDVKLLVKNDARFFERCGDSFIIGVIYGHDFAADYQSDATSAQEASSVATAFEAAYRGFSAGGDVSVSKEVRDAFNAASSRIKFNITSSKKESLPKVDPVSLIDYARNFAATASKDNAYPVAFIYASYDDLLPEDPPELEDEATYLRALYQRRANLKYILQYPASFGTYNVQYVNAELTIIEDQIKRRRDLVTRCLDAQARNAKSAMGLPAKPQRQTALAAASTNAGECGGMKELAKSRFRLRPAVARIEEQNITEAMVQSGALWAIHRPRLDDYPVVAEMRGVYHLTGAGTPANQPLPTNWVINPNSGCLNNPPGNSSCLGTRLVIQEFGTGNGDTYIDRRAFSIPPNSTLYFRVFDTTYTDNTIARAPNSPRIALWQPIYEEDAPPALATEDRVPNAPPPATVKPAPKPEPREDPCKEHWRVGCSNHYSYPPREAILRVARGESDVAAIALEKPRLASFEPHVGVPALPPIGVTPLGSAGR